MLDQMKEEFEKWHGYSVTDEMDIHTAVAWDSWRIAWNAGAMAATVGLPELPTCTKSQTADFVRVMPTISMRKFGLRHPHSDGGSYGVVLTVTGLTSEQQAEAAMLQMERLFCGAGISEQ